jgi:hypothetical protein
MRWPTRVHNRFPHRAPTIARIRQEVHMQSAHSRQRAQTSASIAKFTFAVVIGSIGLGPTLAAAQAADSSSLVAAAHSVLAAQSQVLISGNATDAMTRANVAVRNQRAALAGVDRAARVRTAIMKAGHSFTGFRDAVVVKAYRTTPDSAFVTVVYPVIFDHRTNDPQSPKVVKEAYVHDLVFVRQGNEWTLGSEREESLAEVDAKTQAPTRAPPTTVRPTKPGKGPPVNRNHRVTGFIPSQSAADVRFASLVSEAAPAVWPFGTGAGFAIAHAVGTYDPGAAAVYAYTWDNAAGGGYNPVYPAFSNDCTNFVSQVARAGNWKDVRSPTNDVYADNYWWFTGADDYDHSWTVAHDFHWWLNYSNRGEWAAYTDQAIQGDMMQFDWNNDTYIDHAMVITSVDQYDLYLTGHSNDLENEPLGAILARNPPSTQMYTYLMYTSY